MTKATVLIACVLVSSARADATNERLLEQAKRDAHAYAALVEKQAAQAAEREEKQRRALMAPWRLEALTAAEAGSAAAGPELHAVQVEDGNGRFVPRAWAFGDRSAAAGPAGAAPRGAPAAPADVSRGQAPAMAGTYMGGQYTAPSGAYQLPSTPSVAQPASSYAQPIMPQTR